MIKSKKDQLLGELYFQTSRSGGKGGQHVNKTESRVQLFFNVPDSIVLSDGEKKRLLTKASNLISNDGILQMVCDSYRSQAKNKEEVIQRFFKYLTFVLKPEKPRHRTKIPKIEKLKRLENKKAHSGKKQLRRPPKLD